MRKQRNPEKLLGRGRDIPWKGVRFRPGVYRSWQKPLGGSLNHDQGEEGGLAVLFNDFGDRCQGKRSVPRGDQYRERGLGGC